MSERRVSGSLLRVAGGSIRRTTMNSEGTEAPTLIRLLSVPGILALALLGIAVLAASRLLGADTIVREVVTEVIAGFGNAILILAVLACFSEAVSSGCFAGPRVGTPSWSPRNACGRSWTASTNVEGRWKVRRAGRSWIGSTQAFGPWPKKVSPLSGAR